MSNYSVFNDGQHRLQGFGILWGTQPVEQKRCYSLQYHANKWPGILNLTKNFAPFFKGSRLIKAMVVRKLF